MISSSAHWVHVTQYYGTWYSATALLLMFGCYKFKDFLIDVNLGNEGNQELRFRRIGVKTGQFQIPGSYSGSHRSFWYIFYEAVTPLKKIVDSSLAPCLNPISSNINWLIERRNEINYKTTESIATILSFDNQFSKDNFPNCLSGDLATQYSIFELLLELTCVYAKNFNIYNDSLEKLMPGKKFSEIVTEKIYKNRVPNLVRKAKKLTL